MSAVARPIRVRSQDANRIFKSVSRTTEAGPSRLSLRKERQGEVSAALLLLVDILAEEFKASVNIPNVSMVAWIDLPVLPRARMASVTDLDGTEIPLPSLPTLTAEFDMSVGELDRRHKGKGIVDAVVFRSMSFVLDRPIGETHVRHSQERDVGGAAEASGVWRVSPRHKRAGTSPRIREAG